MSYYFSETQSVDDHKRGFITPKKSAAFANFLGILTGDGCIYCNEKYCNYVVEVVGHRINDREFLIDHVAKLFENLFHIQPKIRERKNRNAIMITAYSKGLYKFLQRIGFPSGKKHNLQMPLWIASSESNSRAFMRGLFDTDGSLSLKRTHGRCEFYPVVGIALKEQAIIQQIGHWIQKHSIPNYIGSYSYVDKRTHNLYTKFSIQISGYKNVDTWMKLVGTDNAHHLEKWERAKMGAVRFERTILPELR